MARRNPQADAQSRLTQLLDRIRKLVFESPYWAFCAVLLAACVLQNGIWYSPQATRFLDIAKDLTTIPATLEVYNQWYLYSYLGPTLAWVFGATGSLFIFTLFHLGALLAFFALMARVLRQRAGDFVARSILIVFFLTALPSVLFTWLGGPDVFTFALASLIVIFWRNAAIVALAAVLLGVNHFEQGVAILALSVVYLLYAEGRREALQFAMIVAPGLLLGRVALEWHFADYDFGISFSRLTYFVAFGAHPYVIATVGNLPALLYSLFQLAAVFLVGLSLHNLPAGKTTRAFLFAANLGFYLILFTLDQTRVFALVTFPLWLFLLLSPEYTKLSKPNALFFQRILGALFVAGLLVPRLVVWEGRVHASAYLQILEFIYRNLLGAS